MSKHFIMGTERVIFSSRQHTYQQVTCLIQFSNFQFQLLITISNMDKQSLIFLKIKNIYLYSIVSITSFSSAIIASVQSFTYVKPYLTASILKTFVPQSRRGNLVESSKKNSQEQLIKFCSNMSITKQFIRCIILDYQDDLYLLQG